MKLRTRFTLIAFLCGIEMIILSIITLLGANRIHNMQNYQFNQLQCQSGQSEIINYINQILYWGVDQKTINDQWKAKVIYTNKKFHELKSNPITKYFDAEFQDEMDEVQGIWAGTVSRINPFNAQIKDLQDKKLTDEQVSYINRYGIIAGANHFPESSEIQSMLENIRIMEIQMKEIMKDNTKLNNQMNVLTQHITELVAIHNQKYLTTISILAVVFFILIVVSNLSGANITIKNIKRLGVMSSELASKDFTTVIAPSGSTEMKALMNNMNGMVDEINKFFIVVKKTAAKAISSGYTINDSSISTASATNEINANIESISKEFEQINESVERAVYAIDEINSQVKTLVDNNSSQTKAIDESTTAISTMAETLISIRKNAEERAANAEEMRSLVADGDSKVNATNGILEEVMGMLDEIGEVITIIDQVTEQTNLLSMNAAIESAHAGEAGKGFAVVAEEIRSLAENTATNAQKINEAVTNVITKVTEANKSSHDASESFSKIAKHSVAVIDSFREITTGIENIDNQTKEITYKTDITASAADKINEYCSNLSAQQEAISSEINSISNLFSNALHGIREITKGTEDIVKRMASVGELSTESYKNMTDLENVLEEFKTTTDEEEQASINELISNNNILSPELQAQIEADSANKPTPYSPVTSPSAPESDSDIDFDPDKVESM